MEARRPPGRPAKHTLVPLQYISTLNKIPPAAGGRGDFV